MPQIQSGTVTVSNGSNVVTGSGVDWSSVKAGTNMFVVKDRAQVYIIKNCYRDAGNNNVWTLILDDIYREAGGSGIEYGIHVDFTPTLGLPILAPGDIETASVLARALKILDTAFSSQTPGNPGSSSSDLIITTTPGLFNVGTAVCILSDGTYARAYSGDATRATAVAIVAQTSVDGTPGKYLLKTSGIVDGVSSLTKGTQYFLKATDDPNNWALESAVTNKVPVFICINDATGRVFVNLGGGGGSVNSFVGVTTDGSGVKHAGLPGLVPAPSAEDSNKVLSADGGWVLNSPAIHSLLYKHLVYAAATDVNAFRADGTLDWQEDVEVLRDTVPIAAFLNDLWMRARQMQLRQLLDTTTYDDGATSHSGVVPTTPLSGTFTVPAGVRRVMIEAWGGGGSAFTYIPKVSTTWYVGGPAGSYVRVAIDVTPGQTLKWQVGRAANIAANTAAAVTNTWVMKPNSNNDFLLIAYGVGSFLTKDDRTIMMGVDAETPATGFIDSAYCTGRNLPLIVDGEQTFGLSKIYNSNETQTLVVSKYMSRGGRSFAMGSRALGRPGYNKVGIDGNTNQAWCQATGWGCGGSFNGTTLGGGAPGYLRFIY